MKRKVSPWIWSLVGFGTIGAVLTALIAIPGWRSSGRASNDRSACVTLRTLLSAQVDFRANDRDGDGRRGYWRKDIAGLYGLVPPKGRLPIRLIEISLAEADAAPMTSVALSGPKAGYWYRTLRFADEDPTHPDPERFAAHSYPDSPASGRVMFIVSHTGVIWRKAAVANGIDVFPEVPAFEGWTVIR